MRTLNMNAVRLSAALALALCCGTALAQSSMEEQMKAKAAEMAKLQAQATAGQPDPTKAEPVDAANPAPQIVFERADIQNGVVSDEKDIEGKFVFRNAGNSPLEIKSTTGSCGCTVPTLSKLVYQPGESGEIVVKYNPKNRNGAQHTVVTVTSNDPKKPSVQLHVHTDVRPIFRVDPQFVQMGNVGRSDGAKGTFTIISRSQDIKVEGITPNSPRIIATAGATVQKEENGETLWTTPVEVTVAPTASIGPIAENITIRTSDTSRVLNVSVMGELLGDVQAQPNRLMFNRLTPGQDITSSIRVTSRNGKPFRILKVEEAPQSSTTGTLSFDFVEDASVNPPAWTINIKGKAPAEQGRLQGDVVVTTDAPNDPTFRVGYFGFVQALPQGQASQPQPQAKPAGAWDTNPSALIPR